MGNLFVELNPNGGERHKPGIFRTSHILFNVTDKPSVNYKSSMTDKYSVNYKYSMTDKPSVNYKSSMTDKYSVTDKSSKND